VLEAGFSLHDYIEVQGQHNIKLSFRNVGDDARLYTVSHLFLESSLKTIGKSILIFILSKVLTSLIRNSFCVELLN
jgi:hypothetical protein